VTLLPEASKPVTMLPYASLAVSVPEPSATPTCCVAGRPAKVKLDRPAGLTLTPSVLEVVTAPAIPETVAFSLL